MDQPVKNPVPIRSESESDKINEYGYGFRLIRSEPDPLTGLPLPTNYRNTISDLKFHGNSDVVEFLGRFNVELGVY